MAHPPELAFEVAFGEGLRFRLGDQRTLLVDLFPTPGVARLATSDVEVTLYRQDPPAITDEGLVFAAPRHTLSLASSGELRLIVTGENQTPDISLEHPAPSPQSISQDAPETPRLGPPVPSETPSQEPPAPSGEPEKQPRVTLRGRLGTNVHFKTLRSGRLVAEFALAERLDDDSTEWHSVAVFDERAEKLRDVVQKGDIVELVGYVHERSYTGRDGQPKTRTQIYATVIKPR